MAPSVLFYPQSPHPESALPMICKRLGYPIVTDCDQRFELAIFWTVRTIRRPDARLARIAARMPVLNFSCRRIDKRHVDRVFGSVFGYRSLVDPAEKGDSCVRKSNLNAMHDGRLVKRPVRSIRKRYVYQRLIDTSRDGRLVEDLRTPVIGGEIPLVYIVRKPVKTRFAYPTSSWPVETRDAFSNGEIAGIRRFCCEMGLDYAELDILRDRHDGRIFIVDVNPTSWILDMTKAATRHALDRQGCAFAQLVRRRCS